MDGKVSKGSILIVDDEEQMRLALKEALTREGYFVEEAAEGTEGVEKFRGGCFSMVITDVRMNGMNGLELLRAIKNISPEVPVLVITAYGTIDNAVEAMKAGAFDYILKPFSIEELQGTVQKAMKRAPNLSPIRFKHNRSWRGHKEIITQDNRMKELLELARNVASSKATVLIQGESGTGKELIARYIHTHSPRKENPFVALNCAAIPENLLESELFGHEKGAFTGAIFRKPGKFELANGGSLLLDEICEMDIGLQAKLLRVLQEFEIERLGGREPIPIDVRIIATTNVDLKQKTMEGRFREDLFYRLNVIPIIIPPLRERRSDIPLLLDYFLNRNHENASIKDRPSLIDEALQIIMEYDWPGNVRELENVIERGILLSRGGTVSSKHLILESPKRRMVSEEMVKVGSSVRDMERELILQTLESVNGNRTHAAEILGISIRTLRNKLNEYRKS